VAQRADLANASVEDLLRKCHRAELRHLTALLRVDGGRKGLRDLSVALGRKLRWVGTHKLRAVLRGLQSDSYPLVLRNLARRAKVEVGSTLAETEGRVLERFISEAWATLDEDARLRLWTEQGLRPPVPKAGEKALTMVKDAFGEQAEFALSTLTLPGLLSLALVPITPIPSLLLSWVFAGPDDKVLVPAVLEVSRLRQLVLHRVTIGVVGSPSSGKDAAINAIFGIDTGNVDPVAGSTREVSIQRIPGTTATYVVNTPGLGDIVESVTEQARQVLDHIDLFVYIVNAQGGVQAREKADYTACVRSGRPVLAVINKIDTLKPADRERYLADARNKLGAPPEDFVAAAFDPLPQLSPEPMGLDQVRAWLRSRLLQAGKLPSELGFTITQAREAG